MKGIEMFLWGWGTCEVPLHGSAAPGQLVAGFVKGFHILFKFLKVFFQSFLQESILKT
jgi:hypothetical protein